MKPVLVINRDYVSLDTDFQALHEAGYEFIWTDGTGAQVPTVQVVPSKADRRLTAACAAMQGVLAGRRVPIQNADDIRLIAMAAARLGAALLRELDEIK